MGKRATLVCLMFGLLACGDDIKGGDSSSDGNLFGEGEEPGGVNPAVTGACIPFTEPLETDYKPGADDAWPECMSDDGKFHPIEPNISSSARTQAFEDIGALLFDADKDASKADFLAARKIYDEEEGLGSRVVRRYDPHYKIEGKVDCTVAEDVDDNPDYCAGPAKILRIVQTAFKAGYEGKEPRWHAGRLEGALLWFSVISEYKETLSCAEQNIGDCDSAYGYYDAAGKGIGLGGYIREVDPEADKAAKLGALAVSCWRENDDALPATDLTLREQARTQFDRPVLKGTISVLLDRIKAVESTSGEAQRFHWGFVTALLGSIQSQVYRASGSDKIIAQARTASAPDDVDLAQLKTALTGIVECAD